MKKYIVGAFLALGICVGAQASEDKGMVVHCQKADVTLKKNDFERGEPVKLRTDFIFWENEASYTHVKFISSNESEDTPEYTSRDGRFVVGYQKDESGVGEVEVFFYDKLKSGKGPNKMTFFTSCTIE